jgi:hypothetical protein
MPGDARPPVLDYRSPRKRSRPKVVVYDVVQFVLAVLFVVSVIASLLFVAYIVLRTLRAIWFS